MTTWIIVACALAAAPPPQPEGVAPPEVGLSGWLILKGAPPHQGKIVRVDERRVVIVGREDPVTFRREEVVGVVLDEVPRNDPAGDGRHVRLVLSDGRVRTGVPVTADAGEVAIAGAAGIERFPRGEVAATVPLTGVSGEVEVWSQGLASPLAAPLRAGELRAGSAGMLATVEAGLTSFLTLGVGGAVPVGYASDYALTGRAWLRAGWSGRHFAFSAGPVVERDARGFGGVYLFGAAAVGNEFVSFGVYAGPRFPAAAGIAPLGEVGFAVRGALRLSRHAEVLAEGWRSQEGGFGLAGIRLGSRRVSLTLGAAGLGAGHLVPWFGFSADATPWRIAQ